MDKKLLHPDLYQRIISKIIRHTKDCERINITNPHEPMEPHVKGAVCNFYSTKA